MHRKIKSQKKVRAMFELHCNDCLETAMSVYLSRQTPEELQEIKERIDKLIATPFMRYEDTKGRS